jgi:hypothetical protein
VVITRRSECIAKGSPSGFPLLKDLILSQFKFTKAQRGESNQPKNHLWDFSKQNIASELNAFY